VVSYLLVRRELAIKLKNLKPDAELALELTVP
jgi:hypothetical protein